MHILLYIFLIHDTGKNDRIALTTVFVAKIEEHFTQYKRLLGDLFETLACSQYQCCKFIFRNSKFKDARHLQKNRNALIAVFTAAIGRARSR